MSKKSWKEPEVRSIDSCQPIFGECQVGATPTAGGPINCAAGSAAKKPGSSCTTGGNAKDTCMTGSKAKTNCLSGGKA